MRDKYKTLITACWIVLICCFIIKLLGGNWFEIVCNNENFVSFCSWFKIDSLQYYVLTGITNITSTTLFILTILNEKITNKKFLLIIGLIVFLTHIVKCLINEFINIPILLIIIDFLIAFVLPIIINKKLFLKSLESNILLVIFQLISLLTKNIGIKNVDNNVITSLIFMIDYYIMLVLYYLYTIKEGKRYGIIWTLFSRFRKRRND